MKRLGVVCALLLVSFTTLAAQPTLDARRINLVVAETVTFESMVKVLGDMSGVAIDFDAAVPVELRTALVGRLHFQDTDLMSALGFITKRNNLAFEVTSPTSVRIVTKAAIRN